MELTVTGRKRDVPERFRRHIEDKLDKIPQLAPRVRRTEVVLTHEANPRQAKEAERCEITCYVHRTVVRVMGAWGSSFAKTPAQRQASAQVREMFRQGSFDESPFGETLDRR